MWKPLTVLATRETLYLLREDHQWRRRSGNGGSSSGDVTVLESLPISCVSSVHLWPSDRRRMDVKLYDEASDHKIRASCLIPGLRQIKCSK